MLKPIFQQSHYLDFHTHSMRHTDREDVVEIVSLHLGQEKAYQYFTVGMHPWWTERPASPIEKRELSHLLTHENCLAMGEMGLDNLKGPVITTQMDILRSQLGIAQKLHKPVVIHCVRAFDQLLKIKKEFPGIPNWAIHGYGRHAILAKQLIDQGFYLSLMPSLPWQKLQQLLESLPHDRLFFETDSMCNVTIEEIYLMISKIATVEIPHLCRQMNSNAQDFFDV